MPFSKYNTIESTGFKAFMLEIRAFLFGILRGFITPSVKALFLSINENGLAIIRQFTACRYCAIGIKNKLNQLV